MVIQFPTAEMHHRNFTYVPAHFGNGEYRIRTIPSDGSQEFLFDSAVYNEKEANKMCLCLNMNEGI